MQNDDELLTTQQQAAEFNVPPSRLNKARLTGDGPPFIKMGNLVRYRRGDVRAWLEAQPRRHSTSEAAAA